MKIGKTIGPKIALAALRWHHTVSEIADHKRAEEIVLQSPAHAVAHALFMGERWRGAEPIISASRHRRDYVHRLMKVPCGEKREPIDLDCRRLYRRWIKTGNSEWLDKMATIAGLKA